MILIRFVKRHSRLLVVLLSWAMLLVVVAIPASGVYAFDLFTLFKNAVITDQWFWVVGLAVVMLMSVHALNTRLKERNNKWLEWSPFGIQANMTLLPLERKWSGLAYAVLLAFCMPMMAWFEELIFREWNNGSWFALLWGGLIFGVVHLLALVTIRMVLCLSMLGFVLVGVYELEGLAGAFMVHATYNLITLSIIIFEMRIREPLGIWLSKYRLARIHFPTVTPWLLKTNEWYA